MRMLRVSDRQRQQGSTSMTTGVWGVVVEQWRDYCNNTTLHGLRYTIPTNARTLPERLVWSCLSLLAAATAILLSYEVLTRYENSPIFTSVDNSNYPIQYVPYFALTLCNANLLRKSSVEQLAKDIADRQNASESLVLEWLRTVPALLRPALSRAHPEHVLLFQAQIEDAGIELEDIIEKLAQPCDQMLIHCQWQGEIIPCASLFQRTKSANGFCCSFNYPLNQTSEGLRVSGAGPASELYVVLNIQEDEHFASIYPIQAISVDIHDPLDYPGSPQGAIIEPSRSLRISVEPQIIQATKTARNLEPLRRKCLFENEVGPFPYQLRYSFLACITECEKHSVLNECGCIPFYYSHKDQKETRAGESPSDCGCVPNCEDVLYFVQSHSAKRTESRINAAAQTDDGQKLHLLTDKERKSLGTVQAYYGHSTCLKYRRDALMTWDSLFATIGGVFGLCLGGSVLSLVELVYYFTVRLNGAFHDRRSTRVTQPAWMK